MGAPSYLLAVCAVLSFSAGVYGQQDDAAMCSGCHDACGCVCNDQQGCGDQTCQDCHSRCDGLAFCSDEPDTDSSGPPTCNFAALIVRASTPPAPTRVLPLPLAGPGDDSHVPRLSSTTRNRVLPAVRIVRSGGRGGGDVSQRPFHACNRPDLPVLRVGGRSNRRGADRGFVRRRRHRRSRRRHRRRRHIAVVLRPRSV